MTTTGGDGAHSDGQTDHSYRRGPVGCRAVTQLTIAVVAPALGSTLLGQRAGVPVAGGNCVHTVAQPDHVYWRGPVGCRAIAQLTVVVGAPALDPAVLG